MLRINKLVFALFSLLLSHHCYSQSDSLIVVTEHMPPFQIAPQTPDSKLNGYSIEIIDAVLTQADIHYDIMLMDWARAFNFAQKKPNTILLSAVRAPEREALFHWLIKLSSSQTSLWASSNNTTSIKSLNEITHEVIAVNKSDHHYLILKKQHNLTEKNFIFTDSKEQAISLILKQRADFILANTDLLKWRLKAMNLPENSLQKLSSIQQQNYGLYIAANKQISEQTRQKIKNAYTQLVREGSIEKITDKWF